MTDSYWPHKQSLSHMQSRTHRWGVRKLPVPGSSKLSEKIGFGLNQTPNVLMLSANQKVRRVEKTFWIK